MAGPTFSPDVPAIPLGAEGTVLTITKGAPVFTPAGAATAVAPSKVGGLVYWFETDTLSAPSPAAVPSLPSRDPYRCACSMIAGGNGAGATISLTASGIPTLNFPGAAAGVYGILSPNLNLGLTTIFAVVNPAALNAGELFSGLQNSLDIQLGANSNGRIDLGKTFTAIIGSATTLFTPGNWFQFNVTYNQVTGAFAFRVARAPAGNGNNIQSITVAQSMVGANAQGVANGSGQTYYNGGMAALIVYNNVLANADILSVENYLAAKWGV